MKKTTIAIIILVLVAAGAGAYYYTRQAKAPTVELNNQGPSNEKPAPTTTPTPNTQTNDKGKTGADYTPPQDPTAGEVIEPNIQVVEVDFDGKKFTPDPVSIKVGDYIFFKNKGTDDFWPLAGSVNTQTAYPTFTAGKPIAPGGQFKFQFTKEGSFSYGDNLHANAAATINVTK